MDLDHRTAAVTFLLRDRAGQFTSSLDAVFTSAGIRILATTPQAPRANAICVLVPAGSDQQVELVWVTRPSRQGMAL